MKIPPFLSKFKFWKKTRKKSKLYELPPEELQFGKLPGEMMRKIFDLLPAAAIQNIRKTGSYWIANWGLDAIKQVRKIASKDLNVVLRPCTIQEKISFRQDVERTLPLEAISDEMIEEIKNELGDADTLTITTNKLDKSRICTLLRTFPHLSKLNLAALTVKGDLLDAIPEKLESLSIRNLLPSIEYSEPIQEDIDLLKQSLSKLTQLKQLSITNRHLVDHLGNGGLISALPHLRNLEELALFSGYADLTSRGCIKRSHIDQIVEHLPNLRKITLVTSKINPRDVAKFAQLPKLEDIAFEIDRDNMEALRFLGNAMGERAGQIKKIAWISVHATNPTEDQLIELKELFPEAKIILGENVLQDRMVF